MPEEPEIMIKLKEICAKRQFKYIVYGQTLRGLGVARISACFWLWVASVSPDEQFLTFYSYWPMGVPPNRRAAMSEYLSRVNWGLAFGNFEMTPSTSQIAFQTSLPISDSPIPVSMLEDLVSFNMGMMNQYASNLMQKILSVDPPSEDPGGNIATGSDDSSRTVDNIPARVDPTKSNSRRIWFTATSDATMQEEEFLLIKILSIELF